MMGLLGRGWLLSKGFCGVDDVWMGWLECWVDA